MAFIKRNLFYIILISAVALVTGGTWAGWIRPKNADTTEAIGERSSLSKNLDSLRRTGANADMVAARKELVGAYVAQREQLTDTSARLNRRGREPLSIAIAGTGEAFPAFPVDRKHYSDYSLDMLFRGVYENAMNELLAGLNGTTPVTTMELEAAKAKMERYLADKARTEAGGDSETAGLVLPEGVLPPVTTEPETAASPTPTYRGAAGAGGGGGGGIYGGAGGGGIYGGAGGMDAGHRMARRPGAMRPNPRTTAARTNDANVNIDREKAQREALNNLMILKVTDPATPIYADNNSFDYYSLPATGLRANIDDMWKANVNYWLHKHIVETINETNARTPNKPVTIQTAIVKRLISTKIGSNGAAGATTLYEGETSGTTSNRGGTGGRGGIYGGGGGIYGGGGGSAKADPDGSLTKRICNRTYDAINFEVTVVLSAAHRAAFEQHLTRGDFYTIQKIDLHAPYASENDKSLVGTEYYYGSEPVLTATYKVEALLFTDWVRDLMPEEMLAKLPPKALRPEDTKRLQAFTSTKSGRSRSRR